MAPEQARGKAVDRRADIWAFGVVLYEMLTGRRAFEGDDISDVLAAVLKSDPDWSALPAERRRRSPAAAALPREGSAQAAERDRRRAGSSSTRSTSDPAPVSSRGAPRGVAACLWPAARLHCRGDRVAALPRRPTAADVEAGPVVSPCLALRRQSLSGLDVAISPDGRWSLSLSARPRRRRPSCGCDRSTR